MSALNIPLLVVITGPTASGKTGLGVQLAKHYQSEVVSCDSRQFYRELAIGTAKPTPKEMDGVPHHFIDSLSIQDSYSVGDFEQQALTLLKERFKQLNPIFLVGGSGLFIRALCEGLDHFPAVDTQVRSDLNQIHAQHGLAPLLQELEASDPVYFQEVDQSNPQRVIRALEVIRSSGSTFSSFRTAGKTKRPFQHIKFVLDWDRAELYDRINHRVELMFEQGLVEEAESVFEFEALNALRTVGYQELFPYFKKEYSLARAKELIQRNTRRYAKRQLTWFRKESNTQFIPHEQAFERICETIDNWSDKHSLP
ncbi:MAG: tRNA (adenosine(37)-N6)-dimethylallyltransferase MiaA [Bacteroidota bacterium]